MGDSSHANGVVKGEEEGGKGSGSCFGEEDGTFTVDESSPDCFFDEGVDEGEVEGSYPKGDRVGAPYGLDRGTDGG